MNIKVKYSFDEQSKAITASAGIEAEIQSASIEDLDEFINKIKVRSEELMNDAVEYSASLTRKYKRGV